MTTTFDDPNEPCEGACFLSGQFGKVCRHHPDFFDPDKDAFAVILSPSAPDRAYERREPTVDDLLDLRNEFTAWHESNYYSTERGGMDHALKMLDSLLASL